MKLFKVKTDDGLTWAQQLQDIIKRRQMAVYMIIGAFLVLLVLYNVGNFIFLNQMSDQLENELSARLTSITILSASLVENEFPETFSPDSVNQFTISSVRSRLQEIKRKNQLEGLFIIDEDLNTVVDSYQDFELNILRTYLKDDLPWIEQARQGIPSSGPLHVLNDQKFKSAYAPIRNLSGEVIGVLTAEANAYFFILLDRYRGTFFITTMISAGVFILFTTFLLYALRLLIRTQRSLHNTEKLAMMGQMSAVLAHEIRNPLGIIRGTADVLRTRYEKKTKPDPMFLYIPDEVNRLNRLVNNFLTLSKDSAPAVSKQDINQLIKDTVEKIKLEKKRDSVNFEFFSAELQPFYFDVNGIQQVVINLVINSLQAIESKGNISITTEKIIRKKNAFVRVNITDDGQGIEGDPQVVFEPFFTTKSSGSGLGMAISKKIIEDHKGWINLESKPGQQTTVSFVIPYQDSIGT